MYYIETLFSEIFMTEAVLEEIMVKAYNREDEKKLIETIRTEKVRDPFAVKTLQTGLGKGESECIVLAKEIDADFVILDDKNARKIAEFLGLKVIGTLGILVLAHKKGILRNLKSVIDEMREKNFWIDNKLYKRILEETG
jgi:predicted nucleic acid-binding protein